MSSLIGLPMHAPVILRVRLANYPVQCQTHRKLRGMQEGIARNQAFLDAVVEFQDSCSQFPLRDSDQRGPGEPSRTTPAQVSKINTTLRQCMRDWSDEGQDERRKSYGAVIAELERLCPVDPERKCAQKVLVPGAGEGRLAYEIVSRGYGCAGESCASLHVLVERMGHVHCFWKNQSGPTSFGGAARRCRCGRM